MRLPMSHLVSLWAVWLHIDRRNWLLAFQAVGIFWPGFRADFALDSSAGVLLASADWKNSCVGIRGCLVSRKTCDPIGAAIFLAEALRPEHHGASAKS